VKYRIKFHRIDKWRNFEYFALQERRWWGWKTLGVATLERVELLRKELMRLDLIEAAVDEAVKRKEVRRELD
jgi:hypothetical protein